MIFHFITVFIIIEERNEIYILIDIKCLAYRVINSRFIRKTGFEYINILIRKLIEIKKKKNYINEVIKVNININKY